MLPLGMAIYGFYACYDELSQYEWYNPANLILGGGSTFVADDQRIHWAISFCKTIVFHH